MVTSFLSLMILISLKPHGKNHEPVIFFYVTWYSYDTSSYKLLEWKMRKGDIQNCCIGSIIEICTSAIFMFTILNCEVKAKMNRPISPMVEKLFSWVLRESYHGPLQRQVIAKHYSVLHFKSTAAGEIIWQNKAYDYELNWCLSMTGAVQCTHA